MNDKDHNSPLISPRAQKRYAREGMAGRAQAMVDITAVGRAEPAPEQDGVGQKAEEQKAGEQKAGDERPLTGDLKQLVGRILASQPVAALPPHPHLLPHARPGRVRSKGKRQGADDGAGAGDDEIRTGCAEGSRG